MWLKTPQGLWSVFAAVHLFFLIFAAILSIRGEAFSDTFIYRIWADAGFDDSKIPGPSPWVYPIVALAPIALAHVFGNGPFLFLWVLMISALNFWAVGRLTTWGKNQQAIPAALWWIGFTALLGWLGFARVDGFTAPVIVVALCLGVTRPFWAAVILSIMTWMKVWPAAVLLALFTVVKQRVQVVLAGVGVTAVIVIVALSMGVAPRLLNFLLQQGDRGMQLEATFTTPWLWMSVLRIGGAHMYMNQDINSMQVDGPGTQLMSFLMQPLLILAALVVAGLIFRALRVGKLNGGADRTELLLLGSLALATAFVVFNKVGSPQFMVWLSPAVAVGLSINFKAWRVPATLLVAIGALTFVVYPLFYDALSHNNPIMAGVLTLRNLTLILLFIWSVKELVAQGRDTAKVSASTKGS